MNYKINSLCLLALKVGNLISDLPFSFRGREAKMENERNKGTHGKQWQPAGEETGN